MFTFIDTASADEYFLVEMIRRAAKIMFNSLKEPGPMYIHVEINKKPV